MYSGSYALRVIQNIIMDAQAQLDSEAKCAPLQGKLWACLRAICAQSIVKNT